MSAQVITFPGKQLTIRTADPFAIVAHAADMAMVDIFCQYADSLAVVVSKGPLHPADRALLMRVVRIIRNQLEPA